MAKTNVVKALAKVMIAAAWADGSVTHEEINSLKDLLFQLPEMTASDWAEMEIYIETPVGEAERSRLVAELKEALATADDKSLALKAVDRLVSADGEISDEERAVVEEINTAIQKANVGIFGQIGKMLGGSMNRRSQALMEAPNRENLLEDFSKNKIFYKVSLRLELDKTEFNIPEEELRKLSLAGGLMARVAYVDREVQDSEFNSMAKALKDLWGISELESALVAEVAISEISRGLDYYRLSRQFFESTSEDERLHFLDVLFAVAAGDGRVSHEEMEEIRTITKVLKLTHKQFIQAKLKIPRERRAY